MPFKQQHGVVAEQLRREVPQRARRVGPAAARDRVRAEGPGLDAQVQRSARLQRSPAGRSPGRARRRQLHARLPRSRRSRRCSARSRSRSRRAGGGGPSHQSVFDRPFESVNAERELFPSGGARRRSRVQARASAGARPTGCRSRTSAATPRRASPRGVATAADLHRDGGDALHQRRVVALRAGHLHPRPCSPRWPASASIGRTTRRSARRVDGASVRRRSAAGGQLRRRSIRGWCGPTCRRGSASPGTSRRDRPHRSLRSSYRATTARSGRGRSPAALDPLTAVQLRPAAGVTPTPIAFVQRNKLNFSVAANAHQRQLETPPIRRRRRPRT